MNENRAPVLVLCDREEEYAQLMTEFMRKHEELPWNVRTYTDIEELMREEKGRVIDVMAVSERTYEQKLASLRPLRTVILNESGRIRWKDFVNVDKYQQAQNVLQKILEVYTEIAETLLPCISGPSATRFIGIYSPVRRCMQTTFALTLSQMLAARHRTLYLNFEHYPGISALAAEAGARDLADLLYFLMADKDKFRLRLQTIVRHIGELDYVPPMKAGQNLISVSAQEWSRLFHKIDEMGEYDYVVMDLSESVQGLFDILRFCTTVFTLTRKDRIAQGKLDEYEILLNACSYGDILKKTCKCSAPQLHRIPEDIGQYTRGEMAEFARTFVQQLEGDET